jgi:hypothetical protein
MSQEFCKNVELERLTAEQCDFFRKELQSKKDLHFTLLSPNLLYHSFSQKGYDSFSIPSYIDESFAEGLVFAFNFDKKIIYPQDSKLILKDGNSDIIINGIFLTLKVGYRIELKLLN